jgi:hypothetical protein
MRTHWSTGHAAKTGRRHYTISWRTHGRRLRLVARWQPRTQNTHAAAAATDDGMTRRSSTIIVMFVYVSVYEHHHGNTLDTKQAAP